MKDYSFILDDLASSFLKSESAPEFLIKSNIKLISTFQLSKFLCFGGTFDYMHMMHKIMLSLGCLLTTTKMLVGVTSTKLLQKKKFKQALQPMELRLHNVQNFLKKFAKPGTKILVNPISKPEGDITLEYDTLLLSEETEFFGDKMNEMRKEKDLPIFTKSVLKILNKQQITDLLHPRYKGFGNEKKISSTDIRNLIHDKFEHGEKSVFFIKDHFLTGLTITKDQPEWILSLKVFDYIIRKYSEPHRHYHSGAHVIDCISKFFTNFLYPNKLLEWNQAPPVCLSLVYHDLVYDVRSSSNETDSAKFAEYHLRLLKVEESIREKVFAFIEATKNHEHEEDDESIPLQSVVLDVDMSILADDREKYTKYAHDIYKEYSFMGRENYVEARTKVLNQFMENEELFYFCTIFDFEKAQGNMKFEIDEILKN